MPIASNGRLFAHQASSEWTAVAAGLFGQLYDAGAVAHAPQTPYIHGCFGLLLLVAVRCRCSLARAQGSLAMLADTQAFLRDSSRRIYLLLYVLFGARLIANLGHWVTADGGNMSHEISGDYLLYGVFSLAALRGYAAMASDPSAYASVGVSFAFERIRRAIRSANVLIAKGFVTK